MILLGFGAYGLQLGGMLGMSRLAVMGPFEFE
jgi:hypothetical protein